jgi:hypothetical protein
VLGFLISFQTVGYFFRPWTVLPTSGGQNRVRAAGKAPYHPGMDLREELPGDRESVRAIHRRAFGDHGLVVADLVGLRDPIA